MTRNSNYNRVIDFPLELRKLMSYDSDSGRLLWLVRSPKLFEAKTLEARAAACALWNAAFAETEALNFKNAHGYMTGSIFGRKFSAHRVAWALHYGRWPSKEIDHQNGVRSDNRIANLREASGSENSRNRASRKDASSRYLGVSWAARSSKWAATIGFDGKNHNLGLFESEEDAARAYDAAAMLHFKDFAKPNFPRMPQ